MTARKTRDAAGRARRPGGASRPPAAGDDARIPVTILGATGAVGQRFVALLDRHPWFRVEALCASDRSAGRPYAEAARWYLDKPMPDWARGMTVRDCRPGGASRVAFSGLDAEVAGGIEEEFARQGMAVVSNARNHRLEDDVPLLVPEVNHEHLSLVAAQKRRFPGGGFIVTNPNCSTVGLVMALAPLHAKFEVTEVVTATLQAVSGAGYPGVASLDILGNVIPYIGGEEEKMEAESRKILGRPGAPAAFGVSAHCHRVPVADGHTVAISLRTRVRATPEQAIETLRAWRTPLTDFGLPSLPERPIEVRDEKDRPQPRHDALAGGGMSVSVGRVRRCPILGLKMVALVHNTIRGAAGVALLNAELLKAKGLL